MNNILPILVEDHDYLAKEIAILAGVAIALELIILLLVVFLVIFKNKKGWWIINRKPHMTVLGSSEKRMLSSLLSEAIIKLSEEKTGALITIERSMPLTQYIDLGVKIDSEVSPQLLQSIFHKETPLHDGAVIIRLGRIECASTYFPLTNKKISSQYGSRHRAALGISEITDSVSIVVSETTGAVSIARDGKFLQVENLNNLVRTLFDELASSKEMANQLQ